MCGRFTLASDLTRFFGQYDIVLPEELAQPRLFNVAPSMPVLGVVDDGQLGFEIMEWGYLPVWAKPGGKYRPVINARGETVAEKPFFRGAFKSARCAIVADGFYEWKRSGNTKVPHWISLADEEVFAMAGVMARQTSEDGSERVGCAIITTGPNELMEPIHDRMPVILPNSDLEAWLHREAQPGELQKLIRPYPSDAMKAHPVSTQVNNPRNNDPDNITPLTD